MYAHPAMLTIPTLEPYFALWPSSQQEIEAGCNKLLGIMDTAQKVDHVVHKDALAVIGDPNIQATEVVAVMVYL